MQDIEERERELNQLKGRMVEKMVDEAPPPPDGVVEKMSKAIVSVFTPEEYRELETHCAETGESISLKIAQKFLSLPRAERKRLSKQYDIPWHYLSKG
jgi:hypothetical protein